MDENGKPSMRIVEIVLQKITDFTKEIGDLRVQLPDKDQLNAKIDKMADRFDRTVLIVKVVFALVGITVVLSIFGAKLINYVEDTDPTHGALEKRIEKMETTFDDRLVIILDRIEKLNNSNQKNSPDVDDSE